MDNCHRPQIGVVGEIYLKFNPYANMYVGDWLISQGVEPRFPDLTDFFVQEFVNLKINAQNNLTTISWGAQLIIGFFEQKIDTFARKEEKIASQFKYYRPKHSIYDEAKNAEQVIDLVNQFGEGWLIPAELASFAERNIFAAISLQPFGCIANHAVSKGIEKKLKDIYPDMNILFLDFDGGVSEVNVRNRLHFITRQVKKVVSDK
jgi:predicted nucleotide-binding protein (sugar kinase/HSP70/actin superfamily)